MLAMELDGSSDHFVREFLGVVLAGPGNQLVPLTSRHGGAACPKALLPVANRPILDYVLSWLEDSGIRDLLIICPFSHRSAISHHIHSTRSSSLSIDLQTYDDALDSNIGTAGILRQFANRISSDFVLLPCDLIPPPTLPLSSLLNKFRTSVVADGTFAVSCFFTPSQFKNDTVTDWWDQLASTTSIVWDEGSGVLAHIQTPTDLDRNAEETELRMALLSRYPCMTSLSNMQDSHVYVCRRSLLDVLQGVGHFESFREEFVPWLCKAQHQKTKHQKCMQVLPNKTNMSVQMTALEHSTTRENPEVFRASSRDKTSNEKIQFVTAGNVFSAYPPSPGGSDVHLDVHSNLLRVTPLIHQAAGGYVVRVNTLDTLLQANQHFLATTIYSLPSSLKDRSLIDQKAQIFTDSIVGHSTRVDKSAIIKGSVIGRHCIIGEAAVVTGCVILDHCVVGPRVKLNGCILGKYTKIGNNANLVHCVTQSGYEIFDEEVYRNERLDMTTWMTDIENKTV